MAWLLFLHLLAAVFWVGGMVLMLLVVRPVAGEQLDPPLRQRFLYEALRRFFVGVWAAIATLVVTGYAMVFGYFGGMASIGLHVHLMQAVAIAMIAIFIGLYMRPFARLKSALAAGDLSRGAAALAGIRRLVTLNSLLGVVAMALGSAGRYL